MRGYKQRDEWKINMSCDLMSCWFSKSRCLFRPSHSSSLLLLSTTNGWPIQAAICTGTAHLHHHWTVNYTEKAQEMDNVSWAVSKFFFSSLHSILLTLTCHHPSRLQMRMGVVFTFTIFTQDSRCVKKKGLKAVRLSPPPFFVFFFY